MTEPSISERIQVEMVRAMKEKDAETLSTVRMLKSALMEAKTAKPKDARSDQGYGYGDLHVRVTVEVPTHLNSAQKAKLEEFSSLCDGNVHPQSQGFFEKAKKYLR